MKEGDKLVVAEETRDSELDVLIRKRGEWRDRDIYSGHPVDEGDAYEAQVSGTGRQHRPTQRKPGLEREREKWSCF